MKLQKISFFMLLCVSNSIWTIGEEEIKPIGPKEHTQELSLEDKQKFEEQLRNRAETEHYRDKNEWEWVREARIDNYIKRAQKLDHDVKRYLMDPSKLNDLNQIELQNLHDRLQTRLKEENKNKLLSSKGLRTDLSDLKANVDNRIIQLKKTSQEQSETNYKSYLTQKFNNATNEFNEIQEKINDKQTQLLELQTKIIRQQNDLVFAQEQIAKLRNENKEKYAKAIETNLEATKNIIKKTEKEINELINTIQDNQDRINLSQEDIHNILQVLKSNFNTDEFKKIFNLQSEIQKNQFIDINKYTESPNPEKLFNADKKLNAIQELIKELQKITPETSEIKKYILYLQNNINNHFTILQDQMIQQYNHENEQWSQYNSFFLDLNYKIQAAKNILDIPGKKDEIEKSKIFLKTTEQEILDYQNELETLTDKNEIEKVKGLIRTLKQQRTEELADLGLNKKEIEAYYSLESNQRNLEKLEQQRTRSKSRLEKNISLQKFFQGKIKSL